MSGHSSDKHVLLVEDDDILRNHLRRVLEVEGYQVQDTSNGRTAQNKIATESFDVIVADIRIPEVNGIELLHFTKKIRGSPLF